MNCGYLKSLAYFGSKKLESKYLPRYKYILFQAMHSYLQCEDIYINVGRLFLIQTRDNAKIQTNFHASNENYEWISRRFFVAKLCMVHCFSNQYQNIEFNIISTLNIQGLHEQKTFVQLCNEHIDNILLENIV